jgi:hypothetical protein
MTRTTIRRLFFWLLKNTLNRQGVGWPEPPRPFLADPPRRTQIRPHVRDTGDPGPSTRGIHRRAHLWRECEPVPQHRRRRASASSSTIAAGTPSPTSSRAAPSTFALRMPPHFRLILKAAGRNEFRLLRTDKPQVAAKRAEPPRRAVTVASMQMQQRRHVVWLAASDDAQ